MHKVLVIVVLYNGREYVDRCLGSALKAGGDLYVVDNASEDGSGEYVKEQFPSAHLVCNQENIGFAKANNMGMEYALEHGYSYVYLLNQDAWIPEDALTVMTGVAIRHPGVAIFSPLQMKADMSGYDPRFEKNVARRVSTSDSEVSIVPYVMAAHWLLPRRTIETVGGFAPIFPMYGEDENYCDRAKHMRMNVAIVPSVKAVHDRGRREDPLQKRIHRDYYMASLRHLCNVNLHIALCVPYVFIYTIVKSIRFKSIEPWKGFVSLMKQLPEVMRIRKESAERHAFLPE